MNILKDFIRKPSQSSSRRFQSGQVIILMAFGMIALLAVLGLAIDGGRLFYLERDAQNASDAAVLAATYALCTNGDAVLAGENAAADNGFVDNGSTVTVTINNPPTKPLTSTLPASSFAEVIITSQIPSYFIHLVYGGDLAVTTYALGHCIPGWDPDNDGGAMMSTNDDCSCQNACSITVSDNDITGNIRCNGEVKSQGADHDINGYIDYRCNFDANNLSLSPSTGNPELLAEPFELPEFYKIEDYRPTGDAALAAGANYWALTGGGNHQINLNRSADATRFAAGGIIYADGNLQIIGSGTHTATITIVAEGDISINADSNLTAYDNGLLLYSGTTSGCNSSGGISYSSTNTVWFGVIYAPHTRVSLSNAHSLGRGAIIGDTISISGSDNEIIYDPSYLPPIPPSIEVTE